MFTDMDGTQLATNGTMCLKFIDTAQEKKIDVGVSWPFEALKKGECIISSDFKSQGIAVGDKVQLTISWTDFWNNIGLNAYNTEANE